MIKLIATDLDGTFLNRWHNSGQEHREIIEQVLASGRHFVVATGRHLQGTHRMGLTFLDLPIYKICMNGALVRDEQDNVIYRQTLDENFLTALYKRFPTLPFESVSENAIYLQQSKWQYLLQSNKGNWQLKYLFKSLLFLLKGKVEDLHTRKEPILKIDCYVADLDMAAKLAEFLSDYSDIVVNKGPNSQHFEITASHVDKQVALSYLLEKLQIDEQDVAVYGNDVNDLAMLTHFPNSFVPNNAIERAKNVAKEIIPSNYENGVVQHITSILESE